MRSWTPFYLLSFLLSFSLAYANDCETVNLVAAKDSPFNKIPVLDQGSVNICYAYTASQMADYHLLRNGSSERSIHAGWVALNYALAKKRKGIEIGHTREALEVLARVGNCEFDKVSALWQSLPPTELKRSSPEDLARAFEAACPKEVRRGLSLPKARLYNYKILADDAAYDSFVRKSLSEAHSPLSISYCSNVWRNQDFDGLELTEAGVRDRVVKGCDYHESLVVGKKLIGGACHFLVRNTWGSRWTKNNRSLKCLCRSKTTGEFVDECEEQTSPGEEHSVEACYIEAQALSRNIGQVTAFEVEKR